MERCMKLVDKMNGSIWIVWIVFALFVILTIVFLSGHGSEWIAGYNTASKEEKERYDKKKLCRVMGCGMAVISVMILVMAIWYEALSVSFIYVFATVVISDGIAIIVLSHTICKKE